MQHPQGQLHQNQKQGNILQSDKIHLHTEHQNQGRFSRLNRRLSMLQKPVYRQLNSLDYFRQIELLRSTSADLNRSYASIRYIHLLSMKLQPVQA